MSKFNKHIVIVGTARSGTSWLSETMASQHRYRMLFEPEHETQTQKGHLLCDKWITSQNVTSEVNKYLKQVFNNRVDSDWIAQNSNRKLKRHLWPFIPKRFIIKFVRANLMAQFIKETYNIPVVHLIRNPYEVLKSQQKVKFPWLYDLSHFANQKPLAALIKAEFNIDLSKFMDYTDLEKLTIRWCIENVLPLEVFQSYTEQVKIIRYEELFSNIQVFENLCDEFNLESISNLADLYNRPSSKTHPDSKVINQHKNYVGWSEDELNQINTVLDSFNTKLYPRQ